MDKETYIDYYIRETLFDLTDKKENYDQDASLMRDTFIELEKEHIYKLLQDDEVRKSISAYNSFETEELVDMAKEIFAAIEMNLIDYYKMEENERTLTIILAAIQDRILGPKEKEPEKKLS